MRAIQLSTRAHFTSFHLADVDVLNDLVQLFPRVNLLKISTLKHKWDLTLVRCVTLDSHELTPLVSTLTSLDLSRSGIEDLQPLAQLVQLEELTLSKVFADDFDPLQALVRLRVLDVSHTDAKRINFVSTMTSLESLDISDTEISDLTPLCGLVRLHTVMARQIKADMAPLERPGASLRVLELKGSTVAPSTTPLVHVLPALVSLNRLSLQPPDHETIEAVSTLMGLQELTLRTRRGLTHAAPLRTLVHLTKLRLGVRSIRIMVALGTLCHLKELAIEVRSHEHTEAYEFRFMKGAKGLKRLELTSIDAISRISNAIPCTRLRTLKLKCFHTYVQQELPEKLLRKSPKLRSLIIEDSSYLEYSLREIDALAEMSQLEHLRVATASKDGGRLSSFWKPLECLTNLRRLELVHAKMQDFTQLRGMNQLVELRFEYGGLRDFAGIEALLSPEVLDFKGSSLPDVTPLRCLKRLRRLVLPSEADCTPVAHGELPCLVELIHPWLNCLGMEPPTSCYRLRHPRKRCRDQF